MPFSFHRRHHHLLCLGPQFRHSHHGCHSSCLSPCYSNNTTTTSSKAFLVASCSTSHNRPSTNHRTNLFTKPVKDVLEIENLRRRSWRKRDSLIRRKERNEEKNTVKSNAKQFWQLFRPDFIPWRRRGMHCARVCVTLNTERT